MFGCATCRKLVGICQLCDRRNRYCSRICAAIARRLQLIAAGKAYQQTMRGRLHRASRNQRYRFRKSKLVESIVTQQSSTQELDQAISGVDRNSTSGRVVDRESEQVHVQPAAQTHQTTSAVTIANTDHPGEWRCVICGCILPKFCRPDGFRRNRHSQKLRRAARQPTGPPSR